MTPRDAICDFGDGKLVAYIVTQDLQDWARITSMNAIIDRCDDCFSAATSSRMSDISTCNPSFNVEIGRFIDDSDGEILSAYPDMLTDYLECDELERDLRSGNIKSLRVVRDIDFGGFTSAHGIPRIGAAKNSRTSTTILNGEYKRYVPFCDGNPGWISYDTVLVDDFMASAQTGESLEDNHIFDVMGLVALVMMIYYTFMVIYIKCKGDGKETKDLDEEKIINDSEVDPIIQQSNE